MSARRGEQGQSLVEVVVAAVILLIGIGATFQALDLGRRLGLDAQRSEQGVSIAQREIERLRAVPYDELGLKTLPVSSSDPASPDFFVRTAGGVQTLLIRNNYRDPGNTSSPAGVSPTGEELVTSAAGQLTGPERFESGATAGVVHRYVTWRDERCPQSRCDGTHDSKRITVAIRLDRPNGRGPAKPLWISSVVTDPKALPPGDAPSATPTPTPGPTVSAQPFFLTDTPCGMATRRTPTSHAIRNTTDGNANTCPAGGSVPKAVDQPDLMTTSVPAEASSVPLFDYSSDKTRLPQQGLLLGRSTSDCPSYYSGTTTAQRLTAHRWSTPVSSLVYRLPTVASRGAFSFWTQTANGAAGAVTLCLTLKRRVDASTIIDRARYVMSEWPTTPTQLSFTLELPAGVTVPAGDNLLLSLSLTAASQRDIVLFYDHPLRQAFMSLPTTTPQ